MPPQATKNLFATDISSRRAAAAPAIISGNGGSVAIANQQQTIFPQKKRRLKTPAVYGSTNISQVNVIKAEENDD